MSWVKPFANILPHRLIGFPAWAAGLAAFVVAFALRMLLGIRVDTTPFVTFFPAIVLATLWGGWGPGVLVVVLSAATSWYIFLDGASSPLPVWHASAGGQIVGFLGASGLTVATVAALARAKARAEAATRLQEALFRELQHRVANNMQIVASTLVAAKRGIRDETALEAIDLAASRVDAMARLHRQLYSPATYRNGLEPVLRDVLGQTFRGLPVSIKLDIRREDLSIDKLTALVLLVQEAATNAAKHVFRPALGTLFEVQLAQVDGGLVLSVKDDGPGTAATSARADRSHGMGMAIMQALARELGGSLTVLDGPGTTLSVTFATT